MGHLRGHVDNAAAGAVAHHGASGGLRDKKRRAHVQIHDQVKVVDRHIEGRHRLIGAGVIHHHMRRRPVVEQGRQRGHVHDVARRRLGAAAGGGDFRDQGRQFIGATRDRDDMGAGLGQGVGTGTAKPAAGAGDHGAAPFQAKRRHAGDGLIGHRIGSFKNVAAGAPDYGMVVS